MKHQVVGFAFNRAADKVALIRKSRPDFLANRLNGLGGKVESGEGLADALTREYREEGGVLIPTHAWEQFATAQDDQLSITFFRCFDDRVLKVKTMTDEPVAVYAVNDPAITRDGVSDLAQLIARGRCRVLPKQMMVLQTLRPK